MCSQKHFFSNQFIFFSYYSAMAKNKKEDLNKSKQLLANFSLENISVFWSSRLREQIYYKHFVMTALSLP